MAGVERKYFPVEVAVLQDRPRPSRTLLLHRELLRAAHQEVVVVVVEEARLGLSDPMSPNRGMPMYRDTIRSTRPI